LNETVLRSAASAYGKAWSAFSVSLARAWIRFEGPERQGDVRRAKASLTSASASAKARRWSRSWKKNGQSLRAEYSAPTNFKARLRFLAFFILAAGGGH